MAEDIAQEIWTRAAGAGNTLYCVVDLDSFAGLLCITVQPSHLYIKEYQLGDANHAAMRVGEQSPDHPLPWTLWKSEDSLSQHTAHAHRIPRTQRAFAAYSQQWIGSVEGDLHTYHQRSPCRFTRSLLFFSTL